MIKKLRRRFIIVNMCILTSVLLGVLSGIFAYMYSSEVKISYELMESIINERNIEGPEPGKPSESAENVLFENSFQKFQARDDTVFLQSLALNGGDEDEYYRWGEDDYYNRWEDYEDYPPVYPQRPGNFPENQPTNEPFRPTEPVMPTQPSTGSTDSDSSATDPTDSSSAPDSSVPDSGTDKPDVPEVTGKPQEGNDSYYENDTYESQTDSETAVTTTVKPGTSVETHTTVSTTNKKTATEPAPKEQFPDPYRGNVKRAYIMAEFESEDDIKDVIYQYFDNVDEEEIKQAASEIVENDEEKGKIKIGEHKLRFMVKENPRMMSGGYRVLFLDRTLEISTINRLLFIFIIIGGLGMIIIFGISVLLANWMVKPVDKAWQQQKQFVADASHELKTPLTVISANTDVVLSNSEDTVKSQSKWLNYIKEETKRMTKLVNSMLYIAKYDSNEIKFSLTPFNLSDIVSTICIQFETLIFEQGKTLETNIEENVYIKGDEDKIKQLVNILLDNAKKYSTDAGNIKVSLSKDSKTGKARLSVANTSEYISDDKLSKLFDRFYRVDDSRNRKTGGSGLGLNIAKTIVEAHKGSIEALHCEGITEFIVTI